MDNSRKDQGVATERNLKMVNAIFNLYQPKSCPVGPEDGGHRGNLNGKIPEGYDQPKGGSIEHPAKKEEVENKESQLIWTFAGGGGVDQGKHSKMKADGLIKLSVFYLKECGYFDGFVTGEIPVGHGGAEYGYQITVSTLIKDAFYVRFQYAQKQPNGENKSFDYSVPLTTVPCRYGGHRHWFKCPLTVNGKYCGKRVAILYKGGDYFGCRYCYNLTYESRNSRGASGLGVINLGLVAAAQDPRNWRYYRGKSTRRFRRALKMKEKFEKALAIFNAKGNARLKKVQERFDKVMNRVGKT